MDLNEISVFVKVVQAGSFTKAARELGMPNSTVSAKVSSLERRLGVTLIQRTTRQLNVTAAGAAFFQSSAQGLQRIEAAENEITAANGEPQGLLKITAPVELGAVLLPPVIAGYMGKYPKARVEVVLSDERTDLLTQNIDLAIRAGELKDSTLIAKKIGAVTFAAFASPKYLKGAKIPADPQDLKNRPCIQFSLMGKHEWKLTNGRATKSVTLPERLVVNDLNMVKAMAVAGHGIALLPSFFCHSELRSGQLMRVLPDWRTGYNPVHFVYPAQRFVMPKLSAFIEIASRPLKDRLVDNPF